MAAEVAATIVTPTEMPFDNEAFMHALLHFVEHRTPTVRRAALDVLAAVVAGGRSTMLLDALDETPEHVCQASEMLARDAADTAALTCASTSIRKSIFSVIGAKTNTPYHVWACWRVLAFLLLRLRENDLMFTLPQLLAMQTTLAAGGATHNAARWTVLIGYLRIASSIFHLPELRTLAKTAWQDSRNKGVLCSELVFHAELVVCKKPLKWQPKSKTAEGAALPVTVPRDKVIELLSHVPAIESNYPDAPAILRGEKDAILPVPAVASSPTADASGASAASAAQLPSAPRVIRSVSVANQPAASLQVHDALRYEALIHSVLVARKITPPAEKNKDKEKKPLSFAELMASAQHYRQDTEKQQQLGLHLSTSSSSSSTAATAAAATTTPASSDEKEKKEPITDAERFTTVIEALASGSEESCKHSIDWRAYVDEKQRWPRIPQLPLF